jgi:hypothetical protein
MKKPKPVTITAALFLFSALFAILYKWGQTGNPFRADTILYGVVIFLIILITGSVTKRLYSKYSGMSSEEIRKKTVPMLLLTATMILIVSMILVSLGTYLFFLVEGYDTTGFINHLFTVELPGALRQYLVWIVVGSAAFFYLTWRKAADREQKLREENLRFRYRTLKAQVNPHFLFNSLNTLSELIASDRERAESYLERLSSIYRYITENEEHDLIALPDEINFLEEFFELQKERDNGKIRLSVRVPEPGRFRVIPVSIQLLAENALKHNYGTEDHPVEINVTLENDYIVVSNNVKRRSTIKNGSTGKGLVNLAERVKIVTGREMITGDTGAIFTVKVPLVRV